MSVFGFVGMAMLIVPPTGMLVWSVVDMFKTDRRGFWMMLGVLVWCTIALGLIIGEAAR